MRVPLLLGYKMFFLDTTFREGVLILGNKKVILGHKKLFWAQIFFWEIQNVFFGCKSFFGIQKLFFVDQGFVVDVLCYVVLWCGAVCVQDFRGCVQDLGALPSAGPLAPTLFTLRLHFRSFFLSWGSFRGILVVFLKASTFGILGLSCETLAAFAAPP